MCIINDLSMHIFFLRYLKYVMIGKKYNCNFSFMPTLNNLQKHKQGISKENQHAGH